MTPIDKSSSMTFTIQDFQNHFESNDELSIPANQSLIIQDASILHEIVPGEEMPKEKHALIFYLIQKIIHPLGKTLQFMIADPKKLKGEFINTLIVTPSTALVIKATRGPITTYLTNLFKMMYHTSRHQFELSEDQIFNVIGIRKELIKDENPLKVFDDIAKRSLLDKMKIILNKEQDHYTTEWDYYDNNSQKYFSLTSKYRENLFILEYTKPNR